MNKAVRWITGRKTRFATLLILLCAISNGLQAQTIYKCGHSYSQTPCPDASTLNLNDAREPAQKRGTDDATQRDAKLAAGLEKDRLTQEKAAQFRRPATRPVTAPPPAQSTHNVVSKITPKRLAPKHHKPDAFIALVPGSDKKPVKKKTALPE